MQFTKLTNISAKKCTKNSKYFAKLTQLLCENLLGTSQGIFSYAGVVSEISLRSQFAQNQSVPMGRLLAFDFDSVVRSQLRVFLEPPNLLSKNGLKMVTLSYPGATSGLL